LYKFSNIIIIILMIMINLSFIFYYNKKGVNTCFE